MKWQNPGRTMNKKSLVKYFISYQRIQYVNYKINNSVENQQIYPKMSQTHLSRNNCYHTTWETDRWAKQLTTPGVRCHCTLMAIRIFNLSCSGILKAPIQKYWFTKLDWNTWVTSISKTISSMEREIVRPLFRVANFKM